MKGKILKNKENISNEDVAFVAQNPHMLLVNLNGTIFAKQGSMAAYQGDVKFKFHGGGAMRMLKKVVTRENLNLMECSGKGDVFLADNGAEVHIINLENEQITLQSQNLLAFESSLKWDVNRLKAGVMGFVSGGLFNTTLTGSGSLAVTSWGQPVVIEVDETTYVDVNCAIAWSTSLKVSIKSSFKAESLIGRGSGEVFQMQFDGKGIVVVQPGEGVASMIAKSLTK
jgi:uncharacterized protein (AIM24 family)